MSKILEELTEFLAYSSRGDFELLPPTTQDNVRHNIGVALLKIDADYLRAWCLERGVDVAGEDECVVPVDLNQEMLSAGVEAVAIAVRKSGGPMKWEDGITNAWQAILAARPTRVDSDEQVQRHASN
jgi:hypothetical protein